MREVKYDTGNKVNTMNGNDLRDSLIRFKITHDGKITELFCTPQNRSVQRRRTEWRRMDWHSAETENIAQSEFPLRIQCLKYLLFIWFDISSPFIQGCQGKLDFMKADGFDERILKHTKTEAATTPITDTFCHSSFEGLSVSEWLRTGRKKK